MKLVTLLMLCFIFSFTKAQQNLVPNPSFEDTLFCPQFLNQISAANGWQNFGNTPDYYNVCNPIFTMPNMPFGYQNCRTGNGIAGIIGFRNPNGAGGPNYREFIAASLTTDLIIGTKYYFTMYVNCGNSTNFVLCQDNLGARFSVYQYNQFDRPPINNFAHIFSPSIVTDTLEWTKISGSFTADSNYHYLIIGNFFDDSNTNTINLGPIFDFSYYYIDDVCVSTDSIICALPTSLPIVTKRNFSISPNPSSSTITINFNAFKNEDYEVIIRDLLSQEVLHFTKTENNSTLDIGSLPSGVYQLSVQNKYGVSTKKFIKL